MAQWYVVDDVPEDERIRVALRSYADLIEAAEELLRLHEPSLLRNDAPRHEVQRERERAWERLRKLVRR